MTSRAWYGADVLESPLLPPPVDVVVRCKDEMPFTKRTLAALEQQRPRLGRIVFIDSGSKDGSRECAVEHGCTIIDIAPSDYVPGRVINMGMRATSSPVVAFVNADAVPLHDEAVQDLVDPFEANPQMAATFGRQVARPNAETITVRDMERAFGDTAPVRTARGSFFSMAASAISRSIWEAYPFDENLRYSEDVDWTYRMSRQNFEVLYVPAARFEHSHDYDPAGTHKRHFGEGAADTAIFGLGSPDPIREFARPLVGSILRDARGGVLSKKSLLTRWRQALGYYSGRRASTSASRS